MNSVKLYNTLEREIKPLQLINDGEVTIYSCGPTVYSYLHIGNWSSYIYWDTLVRTLKLTGYSVKWYMNITDVGHLVSDDDSGEDKLEKGARREGKTAWEVADFYSQDFLSGLDQLNISIPKDHLVKATDNIEIQIELIQKLESKGFCYRISDGLYFDTSKLSDYGKLARLDIEGLKPGVRVEVKDKKNPTDFALWKFSPTDKKRDMQWDSPWGVGFPGWHIECSAMAMHYLGTTLDIHTGGIDHIPVHHTNEIAQSEAATGQTFVNCWLHNNFLNVDNTKLSKSKGNEILLQDILDKNISLKAFRLMVLQSHYRTQSNFTWDTLNSAKSRLQTWQDAADLRFQVSTDNEASDENTNEQLKELKDNILSELQQDLNTPSAIVVIEKGLNLINEARAISKQQIEDFFNFIEVSIGINLLDSSDINLEQKELIKQRQLARETKDWQKADQIRRQLESQGIAVKDVGETSIWSRI